MGGDWYDAIVAPSGGVEVLDGSPNLLLGVAPELPRTDQLLLVADGSTLLLYTDGLVETRDHDITDGQNRLAAAARRHYRLQPEEFLDLVLTDVIDYQPGDDIAARGPLRELTAQHGRPQPGPLHLPGGPCGALARGMDGDAAIDIYWLPLGADDATHCVRWNGRLFEALVARRDRRRPMDLYHSALEVRCGAERFTIEMAPAWRTSADRGVVAVGPVGLPALGRSRLFRYEIRRWRNGIIPDIAHAVASPQPVPTDLGRARRLLDLVPRFPTATWGRDELAADEMWNSNSLTAWLLAISGHDVAAVSAPAGGRAPGWRAGLAVAGRARVDDLTSGARYAR